MDAAAKPLPARLLSWGADLPGGLPPLVHEAACALEFHSAAAARRAPAWLPQRIRLASDVYGDFPFGGAGAEAGEHDCVCNTWGAVSVRDRSGQLLGLRPGEFEVVSWRRAG